MYEASRDIAKAKAVQLEASRYFTYLHPDPSTMPEIRSVSACITGPHRGCGREGDSLRGWGIGQHGTGIPTLWLAIPHAGPGALGSCCHQQNPSGIGRELNLIQGTCRDWET